MPSVPPVPNTPPDKCQGCNTLFRYNYFFDSQTNQWLCPSCFQTITGRGLPSWNTSGTSSGRTSFGGFGQPPTGTGGQPTSPPQQPSHGCQACGCVPAYRLYYDTRTQTYLCRNCYKSPRCGNCFGVLRNNTGHVTSNFTYQTSPLWTCSTCQKQFVLCTGCNTPILQGSSRYATTTQQLCMACYTKYQQQVAQQATGGTSYTGPSSRPNVPRVYMCPHCVGLVMLQEARTGVFFCHVCKGNFSETFLNQFWTQKARQQGGSASSGSSSSNAQTQSQTQTMPSQVRLWWDTQVSAYRVVTPYSAPFVETLKRLIPISDRAWDKESRVWTISERFFVPVKDLCEQIWNGQVTIVTKAQTEKASSPPAIASAKLEDVIQQFFKLCPQDAMNKAYRAAAMLMHPDRGGSMEDMSKLNALWQRLETEFYKKKA